MILKLDGGRRNFYGTCAVALGAWEAIAFATGRVPTITSTTRAACRSRYGAPVRLVTLAWLAGLARHLLADDVAS